MHRAVGASYRAAGPDAAGRAVRPSRIGSWVCDADACRTRRDVLYKTSDPEKSVVEIPLGQVWPLVVWWTGWQSADPIAVQRAWPLRQRLHRNSACTSGADGSCGGR